MIRQRLIGMGHPNRSVYEELVDENPAIALALREAVRQGIEDYKRGIGPVDEDAMFR